MHPAMQMSLFPEAAEAPAPAAAPAIAVPAELRGALADPDAALFVSISGGKDSQAMLEAVTAAHAAEGWACHLYAIHADLGRMEWGETPAQVEAQCARLGVPLTVVRRPQGDLLQEMQERMAKLQARGEAEGEAARNPWPTASMRYCTADQKRDPMDKAKRQGAPFWPDARNRYCTADQKRGPIGTAIRQAAPHWPSADARYCTAHQKSHQIDKALRPFSLVVSCIGIRAQESRNRAKKAAVQPDARLSTRARTAWTWHPILDWTIDQVWAQLGTDAADVARRQKVYRLGEMSGDDALKAKALDGWRAHPAYVYGNERVSCAFCVLATRSDLEVGARHNPELYRTLVDMERESGWLFQQGKPLADVAPELLTEATDARA